MFAAPPADIPVKAQLPRPSLPKTLAAAGLHAAPRQGPIYAGACVHDLLHQDDAHTTPQRLTLSCTCKSQFYQKALGASEGSSAHAEKRTTRVDHRYAEAGCSCTTSGLAEAVRSSRPLPCKSAHGRCPLWDLPHPHPLHTCLGLPPLQGRRCRLRQHKRPPAHRAAHPGTTLFSCA